MSAGERKRAGASAARGGCAAGLVLVAALGCRRPTTEAIEKVTETLEDAAVEAAAEAGPRPDARLVVDGKRLLALGLGMAQVRAGLEAAKIPVIPAKGGSVEELYLRLGNAPVEAVMKAEIGARAGVPVHVSDVATLEMIAGGY